MPGNTRPLERAAGVVCGRVTPQGEALEVLLVRRAHPPLMGAWSLPGGRIEPGESPQVAALRELFEEAGVQADLLGLIETLEASFDAEGNPTETPQAAARRFLLIDYAALWRSGEPRGADDALEARFIGEAQIAELELWDKTRLVIEKGLALIRTHLAAANRPG